MMSRVLLSALLLTSTLACSERNPGSSGNGGMDTGAPADAGDSGNPDASGDTGNNGAADTLPEDTAPEDAGPMADAAPDSGEDAGNNGAPDARPEDTGDDAGTGIYVGTADVFGAGDLTVEAIDFAQGQQQAPVPVRVHAPTEGGVYPVVLFFHGFIFSYDLYDQLLERVASHGFVVVAPTMYDTGGLPFGAPSITEEAALAGNLRNWVVQQLPGLLQVQTQSTSLGYAGHSRGGKVAWYLAQANPDIVAALAGIDPVDGTGGPPGQVGPDPRLLDEPLNLQVPSLLLGSGLGGQGFPQCAPETDNYQRFYEASDSPAWEVVATDFGHNDMMDLDECGLACLACQRGTPAEDMLQLTAGLMVALYRGTLQGDADALAVLENPEGARAQTRTQSK